MSRSGPARPSHPRPPRITLLGGFATEIGGRTVELPAASQRVVAFLAIHRDGTGRLRIGNTLWPDADDAHAYASVRSALWRMRGSADGILRPPATTLRLAEDVEVDLWEAERVAGAALDGTLGAEASASASRSLSEDLLPDWDEAWLYFERERFRELRVHALEALCGSLSRRGAHAEAIRCGLLAIQAEPLRESAHVALMRAHLAEGNRAQALRHYEFLVTMLADELGVSPGEETQRLAAGLPART
jgi:DNA-binding SARP family transcriptional activator